MSLSSGPTPSMSRIPSTIASGSRHLPRARGSCRREALVRRIGGLRAKAGSQTSEHLKRKALNSIMSGQPGQPGPRRVPPAPGSHQLVGIADLRASDAGLLAVSCPSRQHGASGLGPRIWPSRTVFNVARLPGISSFAAGRTTVLREVPIDLIRMSDVWARSCRADGVIRHVDVGSQFASMPEPPGLVGMWRHIGLSLM